VEHLCAHPRHRVLSLRSVPSMPATSVDFTVLQWPGLLKRLRQMQITGNLLEEGLDWSVGGVTHCSPKKVKSVANWLVLRGKVRVRTHLAKRATHPSQARARMRSEGVMSG
jgi:tubulin delta